MHYRCARRHAANRRLFLVAAMAILCLVLPAAAFAQTTATVTVYAGSPISTIPSTAFGVNTATWDGLMNDTKLPPLLTAIGITALRYPGGSWSDEYHWATNSGTLDPNNGNQPVITPVAGDTFDNFMILANTVGASPIITVNYGSNIDGTAGGDPTEAAGWVDYSNNVKGYGVKYWEIGNEVYGNGYYSGADWETDLHDTDTTAADRVDALSLSPEAYADNVASYVSDMKAKDPTIKVGVVLALPDSDNDTDWSTRVLAELQRNGTLVDFFILHWYPEYGVDNDTTLLNDPTQDIASYLSTVTGWISEDYPLYGKTPQIMITETNSDAGTPGKQMVGLVNALFAADDYMTWLEHGVSMVDWWDLHNGPSTDGDNSNSLYGTATYGDEGILSIGTTPEPAAETPFAPYYGIQMLTHLGKSGDQMVNATTSTLLTIPHAVLQANGTLALMLINKDPTNTCTTTVSLSSFVPQSQATTYKYNESTTSIATGSLSVSSNFSVSLPPYSMTVISMPTLPALHVFTGKPNNGSAYWQMISAPETYQNAQGTDLPEAQYLSPSTVDLAIYQPATGEYAFTPSTPADTIRAGAGYWVNLNADATIYNVGIQPSTDKPVYISLQTGWNMIGDPFDDAIPLSQVQFETRGATRSYSTAKSENLTSALYTYPAGATAYQTETNALQPFAGYWIWAKQASTLIVPAP